MGLGLLFLVLFALVLAWIVRAGLGRGAGPVFRALREGHAVCGVCGYAVLVGDAERCPECGTRYDRGGIVTRAVAVRLGPPLWVIALALLPLAGILGAALIPVVDAGISQLEHGVVDAAHFTYDYSADPAYGADRSRRDARPDYRFTISQDMIGPRDRSAPPASGLVTLGVEGTGVKHHTAVYDIEEGRWILRDDSGRPIERGTDIGAAVDALYRHSGADALWEGSEAELADARKIAALGLTASKVNNGYAAAAVFEEHGLGDLSGGGGRSSPAGGSAIRIAGVVLAQLVALGLPAIAVVLIHRARRRILAAPGAD